MSARRTDFVDCRASRRGTRVAVLAIVFLLLAASLAGVQWGFTGEARAASQDARRPNFLVHIFQEIAALKEKPPKVPVVYLLGGSTATASTVSDKSWAADVRRVGRRRVCARNFGSPGQTYAQDIVIVNHLPALPSIVLIGVSLGRYTSFAAPPNGASASAGAPSIGGSWWHGRRVKHILTDGQKRSLARAWLEIRYPLFTKYFDGNAAQLDQLIATCQTLDLHPVLVELPLNLPIVGHAFAKPRAKYRDSCRALAKKYDIPKINFLKRVHLASGDFADLFHLVKSGRVKWQVRLSKTVVSLLERYGMDSR
jgi:hypothetical protein